MQNGQNQMKYEDVTLKMNHFMDEIQNGKRETVNEYFNGTSLFEI